MYKTKILVFYKNSINIFHKQFWKHNTTEVLTTKLKNFKSVQSIILIWFQFKDKKKFIESQTPTV